MDEHSVNIIGLIQGHLFKRVVVCVVLLLTMLFFLYIACLLLVEFNLIVLDKRYGMALFGLIHFRPIFLFSRYRKGKLA